MISPPRSDERVRFLLSAELVTEHRYLWATAYFKVTAEGILQHERSLDDQQGLSLGAGGLGRVGALLSRR